MPKAPGSLPRDPDLYPLSLSSPPRSPCPALLILSPPYLTPQERMYSEPWKTFNVESLERDAVIMLFDVLYEKLKVFTRQYWLGEGLRG
jgi:hypothetical protein